MLLADLDDTLYPPSSGLSEQCSKIIKGTAYVVLLFLICLQIEFLFLHVLELCCIPSFFGFPSIEYMVQKLGIEESKVPEMNRVLYQNYGTTLAGLKVWPCNLLVKRKTILRMSYSSIIHRFYSSPLSRQLVTTLTMMTFTGTNLAISSLPPLFFCVSCVKKDMIWRFLLTVFFMGDCPMTN